MCGCWYMPTKSGKCMHFWVVGVLLMIISYAILKLHMCYIYIYRHNLVIMIKCVGLAISSFSAILKKLWYQTCNVNLCETSLSARMEKKYAFLVFFKISTFLHNRGSLINYHRTLNDLFEEELLRDKKIRTIIFSSLPTIYTLTYTYAAILLTLTLAFFAPPLFIHNPRSLCHFHSTTNYSLPITRRYKYFWTVLHNYFYHFHLLFETVEMSISAITACSMDNAFGFHIYQFASVLHAMTFRLTNLLSTENFSDVLKSCVTNQQKLIPSRNTLVGAHASTGPLPFGTLSPTPCFFAH
ncbi:uncharacterized protein LOC143897330 [Temnothorax americanus]|uniref:uncharacterized protein LOC143897330 n=1 Tax=Temnothorax americanus TaxID=1964332 RepID=UPI004069472D